MSLAAMQRVKLSIQVKKLITVETNRAMMVDQPQLPKLKYPSGSWEKEREDLSRTEAVKGIPRTTTPRIRSSICTISVYVTASRPPVDT